jgi:hypothetical protein
MIDLVFAVDDSAVWHQDNLRRNPGDYSFLKYLGADNIADIQACGCVPKKWTVVPRTRCCGIDYMETRIM